MKKIAIIGSGGAGKSTLARKLSKILDIDVFHLDALFWQPGWVGTPKDEQVLVQNELVQKDSWIFDGNYGATMDIRLDHADTIIFVNLSRFVCTYRILKRWFTYRNKTRPDMGKDCKERISFTFLKFVWTYPKKKKPMIMKKLKSLPKEKKIVILNSRRDVERFLFKLEHQHHLD